MARFLISFAAILVLAAAHVGSLINASASPQRVDSASVGQAGIDSAIASSSSQPSTGPTTLPLDTFKTIRGSDNFWRLGRDVNGVWWFISPENHVEFLNAVTTVQPFQVGRDPDGPMFVSRDWNGTSNINDGDINAWARATLRRIRQTGFKSLGAWSHPIFHQHDIPITRDLNLWTWQPADSTRLYSTDWLANLEKAVKAQVPQLKDSRNLVGYYMDNELDWGDYTVGPGVYFDQLPVADPNRKQVMNVLLKLWPTVEKFNEAWKTELKEMKEIDAWMALPREPAAAYTKLSHAFLEQIATDYFKKTADMIRKYDPNHLILGIRFKGYASEAVVRASAGVTDAQSINYYVNDARLDLDLFRMLHDASGGQPVIISEYSFHSLDGRSGNRNTVGFAAQVGDQQARADGYRLFTSRLAGVPFIVGADWFQWMDEPTSGRSNDGEDVNFGVVDVDDRPYELLSNSIRETGEKVNSIHAECATDENPQIWRESFAAKPSFNVPFLDHPIRLNGELSDWPAQCKLPGVRRWQTVGHDRMALPVPNVYVGWNEAGLTLAFEVFDNDIQGAPANSWWWTRDYLEFWISTRPVTNEQENYDVNSHQFFFVPIDFPTSDGQSGTVGQWHRPGDALKENRIPHPDIKKAVRVMPDRYVVEMFIPVRALHDFDPRNQPAIAFNMHVRNFQHATQYFWSAPKEVMTQLRPKTWGNLYLEKPKSTGSVSHARPPAGNVVPVHAQAN